MPKVAIITPVYNAALYLNSTIRSVLAQTYQDWVLVLVNDGSTDDSLDICKKYQDDLRIKVISQENRGVSTARNLGISCAGTVDYYTFLDSDDLLNSDFLCTCIEYLDSNSEISLLRTRVNRINDSGQKYNLFVEIPLWNHQRLSWRLFEHDLARLFLLLGTFTPVGVVIRANSIKDELWFLESLFGTEDSELLTRLALKNAKMHFINYEGGSYRIRSSSISSDSVKRRDNYHKWLNHSWKSCEAQRIDRNLMHLSYFMILLQLSVGANQELLDEIIAKLDVSLSEIRLESFDSAVQHTILHTLIRSSFPSNIDILYRIGASGSTITAAVLFKTLRGSGKFSFLMQFCKSALSNPLNIFRVIGHFWGKLPVSL